MLSSGWGFAVCSTDASDPSVKLAEYELCLFCVITCLGKSHKFLKEDIEPCMMPDVVYYLPRKTS